MLLLFWGGAKFFLWHFSTECFFFSESLIEAGSSAGKEKTTWITDDKPIPDMSTFLNGKWSFGVLL